MYGSRESEGWPPCAIYHSRPALLLKRLKERAQDINLVCFGVAGSAREATERERERERGRRERERERRERERTETEKRDREKRERETERERERERARETSEYPCSADLCIRVHLKPHLLATTLVTPATPGFNVILHGSAYDSTEAVHATPYLFS